jgi:hypothetical protein
MDLYDEPLWTGHGYFQQLEVNTIVANYGYYKMLPERVESNERGYRAFQAWNGQSIRGCVAHSCPLSSESTLNLR